jgi:site-specific DNA recombinase
MKAIIYARQSKDRDGDGAAIHRQLDSCRLLAKAREFDVVEEIVENDVSATKGARPGFQRILDSFDRGDITAVIVWHTDRLYRRLTDLVKLMEIAERCDVWIMTVRGGDLDLTTASGRMFANMTASVARYEVEHKGERQVEANQQRATAGKWQFSNRPYGYERVDGDVRIVESEAANVREAYKRYLAGESVYSIVENFNLRRLTTTKGGTWSMTTLRAMLSNPAYAGIRLYKGEAYSEQGDWEPIVSRETWEAYSTSKQRRKTPHTWSNRTKYLLSGMATCGVCGGQMMARPTYPRNRNGEKRASVMAYTCTANWCVQRNLQLVDDLVEAVVIARLNQPDAAQAVRPKADVKPLLLESAELRQRKDDLAMALSEGILTLPAVRAESFKLTQQIDALQKRISAADGDVQLSELTNAHDVSDHWHNKLSLGQRRAVIGTLLTVTINKQANTRRFDPKDVVIEWLT